MDLTALIQLLRVALADGGDDVGEELFDLLRRPADVAAPTTTQNR